MQAFDDVLKYFITILTIMNPVGMMPIILNLTDSYRDDQMKQIARVCALAVFFTLELSLILGQGLIHFFGISIASFSIGGGILLFTMAFSMISARQSDAKMNQEEIHSYENFKELGVIPLAIPLLSGPASISSSIVISNSFNSTLHWVMATVATILIALVVLVILSFARKVGRRLGRLAMSVMTRLMGMILLAISIEMILGGLKRIFPQAFA